MEYSCHEEECVTKKDFFIIKREVAKEWFFVLIMLSLSIVILTDCFGIIL